MTENCGSCRFSLIDVDLAFGKRWCRRYPEPGEVPARHWCGEYVKAEPTPDTCAHPHEDREPLAMGGQRWRCKVCGYEYHEG